MEKQDEIRKRKGYARWEIFQEELSLCRTVRDIMAATHAMLDDMEAYGSPRASDMSNESLKQLIADRELDRFSVKYTDDRPPIGDISREAVP